MKYSCEPRKCPEYMPGDESACSTEGLECPYNYIQCLSGPTKPGITATCKNNSWSVNETPKACPKNPKGTCDPKKEPKYVSYSLGCPPGGIEKCLNFNDAFDEFEDAWSACGLNHECGFITMWTDGKFYLRRDTDPRVEQASGIEYTCRGVPKDFPAGLLTCKSGPVPIKTSCADKSKLNDLNIKIRNQTHHTFVSLPEECTSQFCPRGDFAGCIVRLVGHDIMDFNGAAKTGGADGCLDFDDEDNLGLKGCMLKAGSGDGSEHGVSLESLWQEFCTEVSIADFFVIAAETLMAAASPSKDMDMWMMSFFKGFRFGRKTAKTCHPPDLPKPDNACVAVEKSFIDRLGLTADQATALMGVHTLGRAQLNNSGFDGFWLEPAQGKVFSNRYFQAMIAVGWVPAETSKNKWQWVRADVVDAGEMMLNTDMCLAYQTGAPEDSVYTMANMTSNHGCCLWKDHTSPDMVGVDCLCKREGTEVGCTHSNCCLPTAAKLCENDPFDNTMTLPNIWKYAKQTNDAVSRFAQKTNGTKAWHDAFMSAWNHTTVQGHDELCD